MRQVVESFGGYEKWKRRRRGSMGWVLCLHSLANSAGRLGRNVGSYFRILNNIIYLEEGRREEGGRRAERERE